MFLMKSRWPGASSSGQGELQKAERHTNDSDIVVVGAELPQGNVDGDAALALGLELVEHPGVLEGALAEFGSFLGEESAW
jgi:hypothetical protein